MPPKRLKLCCKKSLAQGMSYCPTCHTSLLPDETTLVRSPMPPTRVVPIPTDSPHANSKTSNRSWLFGMIIACLSVFAAIVIADYFVQRKVAREAALALATPSPAYVASPSATATSTPTPTPKPTPTTTPDLDLDGLVETADPYLVPIQEPTRTPGDFEKYVTPARPDPTATTIPTPRPTPRPPPRAAESLVNAHDVMSPGYGRDEDTRRYRFHVENTARVKGSFSARGNVSVKIVAAGIDPRYSSDGEISGDTIDVLLYPGTYELVVTARSVVGFSVQLTAYYSPE
jgi:hypothetical protein